MQEKLKILDTVALIEDISENNLMVGQVGTIVDIWDEGVFEVEFNDNQGRTYAMLALRQDQVIALHYSPAVA
ncbi:MAG: DUF4926 domain-containing protein [Candidatus Sumerlaeota bacterium]